MKIWYQSGLSMEDQPQYAVALNAIFDRVKSPDTQIVLHGRGHSAKGLSNSDVIGSPAAYFAVYTPRFISAILQAEAQGFDAFVVGSFSEPIIAELRSLATFPVITMPEAAMLLACTVAPKFAMVSISRIAAEPYLPKTAKTHGLDSRLSGIEVVDEVLSEEELHGGFANPTAYLDRFRSACRRAIANGAQAIVPAEGMLASLVAQNGIFEIDGAPVIDSIAAPVLFAEMAVRLRRSHGWQQSRVAYPRPTAAALDLFFNLASRT